MKTTLLLCALAVVLSVSSDAAMVRAPAGRASLNLGYVSQGDKLFSRQYLAQPAIPNAIQYQDFVYRGNRTSRITAIQAIEVGYTQWASATLISGGIGQNNATIRVQSARGYGYYYQIDIWGR